MSGKLSIRSRAPVATSPSVRRAMRSTYGGELRPERSLRSLLHRAGLRFRKHRRPLPVFRCTADIVFPRQRLCVFVDGCFWHGCPRHFSCPKQNSGWWREKIADNIERDKRQTKFLRSSGWRVIRVWEHEVGVYPDRVVRRISRAILQHTTAHF
ncbi:MAG: very short patch repair endonuclease [Terriglobia bacterium]